MTKISPRVDIAFKKIFGVEENKDLLISLINSIVGTEDQVSDLTLLNPYNPKHFKSDKLSILDIKAMGPHGKRFNIEIQISDEADYDKRALYYWAKLYTEQLKTSEDYSSLSKAIGIHILNFTSIPEVESYHNVFHIAEKNSGILYFKDLELHTIELKKFSKDANEEISSFIARIKSALDLWVAFLTKHELLNKANLPQELAYKTVEKALNVLEIMNFSVEEREAYEDHLKWLMVEANTLKKSEEKGRAEGRSEGRAEGEIIGVQKTTIVIAAKMLDEGYSVTDIAKLTGLTTQAILALQKS